MKIAQGVRPCRGKIWHEGEGPLLKAQCQTSHHRCNVSESRSVQTFLHNSQQSIPILYNGPHFPPQNCPYPWGIWTLSNTPFLGPIQADNLSGISIGSAVCCAQLTEACPYILQWATPSFPSKLPLPLGGSGPYLIHDSLGPPQSSTISIGSAVFAVLTTVADGHMYQQPDRHTTLFGRQQ